MFVMFGAAHKRERTFVLLKKCIVLVWCCREIRWLMLGAVTQLVTFWCCQENKLFELVLLWNYITLIW